MSPSFSEQGREVTVTPGQKAVEGILVHSPVRLYSHPWYGHCTCPSTTLPRDRGQARWAHSSFTHAAAPFSSRKSTHGSPNSSNGMSLSSVSLLVKCAGYQWLRRPGSNRRLLVRWRDLGRRGTTLPLPLRCCGSSCRSVDEAPPRPLSRTGGGAVATAVAEEEVAAEAAMEARPPIMPDARPAAKAGDAASAASVAAFMRSSWAASALSWSTRCKFWAMRVLVRASRELAASTSASISASWSRSAPTL
mmetsp:Transcript_17999/g.54164  ORF Transcript_17999/g.54164 Transcript_17999/m.54164 type:complete len:249 (+) Transcript_17999:708-1454(+)